MHAKLLGEFGGWPGLPGAESLQSSLARPQQLLAYGEPSPSIAQLAASYGFALARDQCFGDGNKRIALAVIDVFLRINGSGLSATEEDAADTIRRLAAGELTESDLAVWISANQA